MEGKIDLSLLDGLSEDEKRYALQILKELSNSGSSKTYDNLKYSDYKEIPVDIETFLTDDRYLGIPWKDKNGNLKLYPFWLDVLKKLFPNNTETAYDTLLESGARGLGKAQPLYSKLLTSDGFITMGEVKVGDFIYGEDGKTHRVTHIFPQGEKDIYEITFSDNTTVRCCKEHLWTIIQKWNHNKKSTMSLEEIMNRGLKANAAKSGAISCRFGVPITSPLEFEHKDVFISPYTLGVLIGDGYTCGNSIRFTSTDDEIIGRVNSELLSNKYTLSKYQDSYSIVNIDKSRVGRMAKVNKYKQEIHNLKLAVRSDEKFIPKEYLLTDIESRIQLLQGLMDTDGYIDKKGYLTYCTTSKRLKDDFIFLVQSLGGTAPCRFKRGKYRNAEGVVVECKNCYNISVNLPSYITPFHLTRKLNRLNVNKHEPFRTIRDITFVGKEECQCILIDSDTHLYLTDNLIVTHNSEIACGAVCAYLMYRVMCLKDPLEFFHLKPTEKIAFAFMNIKLDLSEAIANDKFQKTIQMSPWFMSKGTMTQRHNKPYWIPPQPIEIIIGSQADDIIGRPIFFCFFDEISFQRNKDIEEQKKKALNMIDTAIGGQKTRFIYKGKNPTLLVVASSKRSEQSFMESYIRTLSETQSDNTYIVDEPVWKVKPKGTYSEETFFIGLGNKHLDSIVIPDEDKDKLQHYKEKGYQVIEAPIDFRAKAIEDLERMLCDYAGISSFASNKFLSAGRVNDVVDENIHNPMPDIIEVGNGKDDESQYYDFFDWDKLDRQYLNKPLFIHLDMSISGDKTGIAGTWIIGKKPTSDGNPGKDLYYELAFCTSVKAPKGRQISFEKNRNFIRWLKEKGFKIKEITSDTFQSYDLQQQLSAEGFKCSILSVDRVETPPGEKVGICKPYQYLKNTIYEGRIKLPKTDLLHTELVQLEKNNSNGKIDHPNEGKTGSKDSSDALCLGSNTQIYLLNGLHKTIKELYDESINNSVADNWVLAYNTDTKNLEPVKIASVVNNGYKDNLIKLTLDNREEIICTPDHKLLTRCGDYVQAQDSLNISLMPFNYINKRMFKDREYPYIYIPQEDGSNKGIYLHKLVCENLFLQDKSKKIASKKDNEFIVIHHKDCNRFNNNPENLEYLTNVEHSKKHTLLNTSEKKKQQLREYNKKKLLEGTHSFLKMSKEQRQENGRKTLIKLNKSEAHRKAISENNKKLAEQGLLSFQLKKGASHTPEANLKRQNTFKALYGNYGFKSKIIQAKCRQSCLEHNGYDNPFHSKEKQFEMRINKLKKAYNKILSTFNINKDDYMSLFDFKLYCNILNLNSVSSKPQDIIAAKLNIDINNFNEKEYKDLRNKGNCVRLFLRDTNKDCFTYEEFSNYYEEKCLQYDKEKGASNFKFRFRHKPSYEDIVKLGFKIYNHRVIKIEKVTGDYVYDLKLDKIHNFALTAGIFVHNCGSVYTASKYAEEFAYDYGESLEMIDNVNNEAATSAQQLIVDFEEMLKQSRVFNSNQQAQSAQKNNDSEVDLSGLYINDGLIIW